MSIESRYTLHVVKTKEGVYRVDPLPTEKELAEYYEDEYYKKNHANYKHKYTDKEIGVFVKKVKRRINALGHLFPWEPDTCLDVGCGEGWGLKAFSEEGWEVTGLDYTTYSCSIHNSGFVDKIITGDLYNSLAVLIKEGVKYQVLHLDNILEHVADPYKLLEYCKEVIKPSGVMIIEVPNSHSKHYQYLYSRGMLESPLGAATFPDHLSYFDIDSLRNICTCYGFKEVAIVDFTAYGMNLNANPAFLDEYLGTCPFEKVLRYTTSMADLGLGGEILGFWGVE